MLACLSCTSDPLPRRTTVLTPCSTSRSKFSSQEAFILLQKCTNFHQLKQIHGKIIRHDLSGDQLLARKLLNLCSSYGRVDYATLVFHQLRAPLTFTWNLMIRALTIHGSSQQALHLFNLMNCQGSPPDKFTFPFVIKACTASSAINKGKEVHGLAIKTGYSQDMFLQNTLMDMYFKCEDLDCGCKLFEKLRVRNIVSWTTMIGGLVACGKLDAARRIFEKMPRRNVVSWTAMINGYVRDHRPEEALELFHRMLLDNVRPNEFTLVSLLKACTQLGSLKLGNWVHDFALKNGFRLGVYLGTALIDMYSKCGSLEDARKVFDKMEIKNLATWNSMITSLGVHGFGEEALALFVQLEKENKNPDAITFIGVLSACVHTNNISEGYRYFKYMTEHYGIIPDLEHVSCMIELYKRANMSATVCKLLINKMPVQLSANMAAASLRSSIAEGVAIANLEKISYPPMVGRKSAPMHQGRHGLARWILSDYEVTNIHSSQP